VSVIGLPALAQQRVSSLRPYRPGRPAVSARGKLSSNESPLGPAPGVRDAVLAAISDVSRYPDAGRLTRTIARLEQVAEDQIVLANGSDELCYLLAALFVEDGANVVLSDPCYQVEELVTRLHGGEPVFVPVQADGGHDLTAMAEQAEQASVVWLPTPHNPTGVAVEPDELESFIAGLPPTCLVVLDEAYRAYLDPERRPAVRALVERHPNVVVQRTFSKDYALAGLRIGYAIGSPELIDALLRIKPPFNVNALAIAAAEAAVASAGWREYTVLLIRRERARLERTLTELGVRFFSSQANFVTFAVPDVALLQDALLRAGLMARDGADLGLPGWLRVSVGAPAAMAQLRTVLKEVL